MARKVFDADYDFIGFTYNGYHSIDDLKIYRVSDGDRYNLNISPTAKDKTADVPGGDGMYYLGSYHTKRDFAIKFVFDDLSEEDVRKLSTVFNGQSFHELIFDEWPYKAYDAKISQSPTINYICFDINGERVYKGEGTLNFTCVNPYAHTPEKTNAITSTRQKTISFEVDTYIEQGKYIIKDNSIGAAPRQIAIDLYDNLKYWSSDFNSEKETVPLIVPNSSTNHLALRFDFH